MAIWSPLDKYHPPYGRVDGVVYYGATATMQPLDPVAWDDVATIEVRWDPMASVWTPVLISDTQLSANVALAPGGVLDVYDGSNLFNVPPPVNLAAGNGALDGAGTLSVPRTVGSDGLACSWFNAAGAGQLYVDATVAGVFTITSSAGAADSGMYVGWVMA